MRAVTFRIVNGPGVVQGVAGSNSTREETWTPAPRPDSHVLSSNCSTATCPSVCFVTFMWPFGSAGSFP